MAVTLTESTKVSGANRATLYTRIENNRTERLIEWGGSYYLIGGTTGNLTLTPTAVNTATLQKDTTLSNNLIVYKDGGNIYIKDDNNGSVYSVRADSATNNGLSTVTYNLNVEAGTLGGGNSSNLETGTIDLNTARFLLNEKVQVYTPSSTTLGTQNNTPVVYLAFRENNTDQIYGYNTGTNTLSFIGNRLPAGVTVTQAFSGKSFQVISDNNGKVYLYADGTVSEPDWQNNTLVLVTKTTTNGTTGTLGGINNVGTVLNTIGGLGVGGLGGLGEIFDGNSSLAPLVVAAALLGGNTVQQVAGGLLVAASLPGIIQGLTDNNSPNNSTVEEEEVRPVSTVTETASTKTPTKTPTETPTETTTTADAGTKEEKKEAGTGIILLTPEEYEKYLASGGAAGSSGNDPLPPSVLAQNTVEADPAPDPAPAQTPAASTPTPTATPTPKPKPKPAAATPETKQNTNKQTVAAASESKTKKEPVAAAPMSGSNPRTQQPIVPPSSPPSTPKEEESITIKGKDVTWK
ncbi:MAG: hypothetical protein ACK48E_00130, partial [Holosporales bacterium]